ncbi:aspartate dehydrogenase domain-containing protein [Hominifimenecus sp. rT4P-3]|uniref:aspartate dehydrogenase domain-containing protein n=1 Tax=Hominifimenecus sp. rT4P-3 TaxID=3242979 RepID=UPI003DA49FFA
MKKSIGFLGCGKIGRSMLDYVREKPELEVSFVQDPFFPLEGAEFPVCKEAKEELLQKTDLVVECAMADVLKAQAPRILPYADLLAFSVTAFQDEEFYRQIKEICRRAGTHVYFPHGAILGMDGIFDGRSLLTRVEIETIKNPQSLGRDDTERTIVYEGPARQVCKLYPRNVNVHASVALAGIGFDRTISRIISDPAVATNAHRIHVEGDGVEFEIQVSSRSDGSVTGAYTPVSALGSLKRVLEADEIFSFV